MLKCMLQGARRVSQEKASTPLRTPLSNHRGETHFHDCTEMGLEAIERLCFLASFPLPGTGKREGGKKTQPFNRFASHPVTQDMHCSLPCPAHQAAARHPRPSLLALFAEKCVLCVILCLQNCHAGRRPNDRPRPTA